jgi:predicted flap endonuclease-1-like 5' DNA nuclease
MPEITVTMIGIVVAAAIIGVVIGWLFRGNRAAREKTAISEGWQEQLEAQRGEHQRLLTQNKSLMEQNSQYQASNQDAKMRASELSGALKEAFERRDELQRQLKDIRGNLESAVAERDQLRGSLPAEDSAQQIAERDAQIQKLGQELTSWQQRLPPLIERFQQRNAEADELARQLDEARDRIAALEQATISDDTRVEPVDTQSLGNELNASNETIVEYMADSLDEPGDTGELQAADPEPAEAAIDEVFAEEMPDIGPPPVDQVDGHDTPGDDLQLIKGVGPAIEKTLNEMGIRRFDQIAQMSEYDIDRVANRLKGFRSRIYREDWIGQARDLYDQKVSGQQ